MKIRKATKKDLDDLIELFKETIKYHNRFENGSCLSSRDLNEKKDKYLAAFKKKLEIVLVAEDNGKVVGSIWGKVIGSVWGSNPRKDDEKVAMIYL